MRSADWQYIRETEGNPTGVPHAAGVNSNAIRCYEKTGRPAAAVQTVAAGSRFGFASSRPVNHPGPSVFYLARVPDGQDVDSWTPSGDVWFKIGQQGYIPGGQYPPFETEFTELYTTIPEALKPGNYLLRVEHISLILYNEPHFHIGCAQLNVTGTGTSSPEALVSFPGAYTVNSPSWAYPIFATYFPPYPYPGPAVWQ